VLLATCGCSETVFVEPPPVTAPAKQLIALGGGHPGKMALARSGLWVTVYGGRGRSRLVRVDPATRRVTARIPVRGSPFYVAARGDAVWVTGNSRRRDDVLYRVDPRKERVVATIPLPGCYAGPMAADRHGLWLLVSNREVTRRWLVRVNARNRVVRRTPVDVVDPAQVTVGQGFVWLVALRPGRRDSLPGDLLRFDPRADRVTARIKARAYSVALGRAGMWFSGCVDCFDRRRRFDFAQRVDTHALRVVGPRIAVRGVSFGPVFVGAGSVWFGGYDREDRTIAFNLDQESSQIGRFLSVSEFVHSGMAFDPRGRALWVSRAPGGVLRVDLSGR
jgi:DNA-binding beta-propeller fold protein YncE